MKRTLIALLFGLGFMLPAHAQYAMTCTRDPNSAVNIRRGPSRSYAVVASIPSNEYVRIMNWVWGGDGMRWYRIEYGGIVAYARADYLCR